MTWRAVAVGDAAEAVGGVVELRLLDAGRHAVLVDRHGLARPHGHVPGLAVDLDARTLVGVRRAVVGRQQRLLDRGDQHVEADLPLALEQPQRAHVDVHVSSPVRRLRRPRRRHGAEPRQVHLDMGVAHVRQRHPHRLAHRGARPLRPGFTGTTTIASPSGGASTSVSRPASVRRVGQPHRDRAPDGAHEVAPLGQRTRDAAAADLERVVPRDDVGRVERVGDGTRRVGDAVQVEVALVVLGQVQRRRSRSERAPARWISTSSSTRPWATTTGSRTSRTRSASAAAAMTGLRSVPRVGGVDPVMLSVQPNESARARRPRAGAHGRITGDEDARAPAPARRPPRRTSRAALVRIAAAVMVSLLAACRSASRHLRRSSRPPDAVEQVRARTLDDALALAQAAATGRAAAATAVGARRRRPDRRRRLLRAARRPSSAPRTTRASRPTVPHERRPHRGTATAGDVLADLADATRTALTDADAVEDGAARAPRRLDRHLPRPAGAPPGARHGRGDARRWPSTSGHGRARRRRARARARRLQARRRPGDARPRPRPGRLRLRGDRRAAVRRPAQRPLRGGRDAPRAQRGLGGAPPASPRPRRTPGARRTRSPTG